MRGDILKQYLHKGEIRHGIFSNRPERQRKNSADLANEKVKTSNGNVVFIKKSHKDTYTVDFNIRVIRMADYPDVLTLEEFVGFLYGMAAGNHDIEAVFIDSVLKQANITLESLAAFLHKLNKISTENNIDFYLSISADKKDIPGIDSSDCTVVS